MPRLIKSARAEPGSDSPANSPQKAAPQGPQFTESSQPDPSSGPDRPEQTPNSADGLSPEELSLDRTEPFPPGLFRVPVPNAVFSKMPEMSDSALRCLLALIHLSFRFDPSESKWIHAGDWFSRSDVEEACGLSGQGTRNGLAELESIGWAHVDRSSQSHQYQLTIEVPARRFTYVPTSLLEGAPDVASGTKLRVVLAVIRGTWGWTYREKDPESGSVETVHDRWARLSNRELANATGRSETAVGEAASALQVKWIERVRPGSGPYQYRVLPEEIGDGSGNEDSFCGPASNDLAPDRQKSGTPTSYKKSSSRDKHSQPQAKESSNPAATDTAENEHAMLTDNNSGREPDRQKQEAAREQREEAPAPDFRDLPPEKQELAEKLANVGVWAGRIAEILSRFSRRRIRANFELYRQRAAEQTIRRPGAWLYDAITEGYALPSSELGAEGSSLVERSTPEHKETLSEAEKEAYVAGGIEEERFHRCLSPGSPSSDQRFMYFSPDEEGPERRI